MNRFPRLYPSRRVPPLWVAVAMIVFGVGGMLLLACFLQAILEKDPAMLTSVFTLGGMAIAGVCMLVDRRRNRRQITRWAEDSRLYGLKFDEQVTEADLEPFLDSPLFRFGEPGRDNAY